MIDRRALAAFLRARRENLQPEDVGIARGPRRRTSGLRREEVAALSHMSADYYSRLEQARGPHPSSQMILSVAQALHLSREERDHILRLAGHRPPEVARDTDYISPGLMRIFDRLREDTPAEIVTELGETLRQTPLSIALFGDRTRYTGHHRSIIFRWFADPETKAQIPEDEHEFYSRMYAAGLREIAARHGAGSRASMMADELYRQSASFHALWDRQEVGIRPAEVKRHVNGEVGVLELNCQILIDPHQSTTLLVYTAEPGSESDEKLRLLGSWSSLR